MARRLFFVDSIHRGEAEVKGDDAGHLTKVLRVEKGQIYEISDNDTLYLAEVTTARREHVVFRVLEKRESRPLPVRMHLLAAIIKFDHFEWMLEKATELGVEQVTPLIAERTEKGLDKAAWKRMERWRKILKESSQQCRRVQMPSLADPLSVGKVQPEGLRLLCDEAGGAPLLQRLPESKNTNDVICLMIGPEGGWADHERTALTAGGWVPVSLGSTILRAETAAIAALAVVSAAWHP